LLLQQTRTFSLSSIPGDVGAVGVVDVFVWVVVVVVAD
jgi:hypothetical protein